MHPPTKRQRQLEHAIEKLTVDGVSPSYDELASELGITRSAARAPSSWGCAHADAFAGYRDRGVRLN